MPKRISEADLSPIEEVIRNCPTGASMGDLVGPDASEAERRAMQRRLKKLVALDRVKVVGNRKATRYFTLDQTTPTLIHEEEAHFEPEAQEGLFVH